MLGLGKLQVLESKLNIYEDLSKEMLDKLERAVGTISDNSNKIAIILERHENRLDESDKNDATIMKLIEKVEEKVDNIESRVNQLQIIEKVEEKVDNIECRVNQLQKFRWMTVGVAIAAMTLLKAPEIFSSILTPNSSSSNSVMERVS